MRTGFRAAFVSLALLVPFGLAAPATPAATEPPYEIDAILSLTGSGSFLGTQEADALALVEKRTNATGGIRGRPIAFVVADDQSSPQVAVQLLSGILQQKKPSIMIGSSLVAACSAMLPLVVNGPVVYCLSAGFYAPKGTYMFSYGIPTREGFNVTVRYFRERGWKRVAAIFPTDATGQDGEHGLDASLALPENAGVTLVAREHFNPSDVTVSAQVARIKAAAPQALLAWGTGTPIGTVLHSALDGGLDVPTFVSASNLNYKEIAQYSSILPKELYIVTIPGVAPDAVAPGPLRNAASAYYDAVRSTGVKPDGNMAIGWDPGTITVAALRTLGPGASAAQLQQYLESLHGVYGAAGQYDFRDGSQRGLTGRTAIVVRYDAGKGRFVAVSKLGGAYRETK